uniref:Uncharacterized protein n=1 Tax=Anguilla anguilla TaxID=7936 RepID=A0A0E9PBD1_ANGAN
MGNKIIIKTSTINYKESSAFLQSEPIQQAASV